MLIYTRNSFVENFREIRDDLLRQKPVNVGTWQSQKIDMPMLENFNVVVEYDMPDTKQLLAEETGARLPWAEDHFQERIGGEPLNPAPSEAWWPFRKKTSDGGTNKDHKSEGEGFSHTYPERFWPKNAGPLLELEPMQGIRFKYGDLNSIIDLLAREPHTRQAYLPIWFPEDGGAIEAGKRVPCTLGYHFQIRDNKLHISYFMRSTDLLRHYQDDIYMAVRLAHHVADQLNQIRSNKLEVGTLIFHTANMHIFEADRQLIEFWKTQDKVWF